MGRRNHRSISARDRVRDEHGKSFVRHWHPSPIRAAGEGEKQDQHRSAATPRQHAYYVPSNINLNDDNEGIANNDDDDIANDDNDDDSGVNYNDDSGVNYNDDSGSNDNSMGMGMDIEETKQELQLTLPQSESATWTEERLPLPSSEYYQQPQLVVSNF